MIFKRFVQVVVLEILKYWRQPNFCHLNNVQWKYYLLLFETCFSQSPNTIFWVCSYAYSRCYGVPPRNLCGTKVLISSALKCVGCWWLSLKLHQIWDLETPNPSVKGVTMWGFHPFTGGSYVQQSADTDCQRPWPLDSYDRLSGSRALHRVGWHLSCNLMRALNFPLCNTALALPYRCCSQEHLPDDIPHASQSQRLFSGSQPEARCVWISSLLSFVGSGTHHFELTLLYNSCVLLLLFPSILHPNIIFLSVVNIHRIIFFQSIICNLFILSICFF